MMIKVAFPGKFKRVRAIVFGQWAAHRNVEPLQADRSRWVVTHVPSGMSPLPSNAIELTRSMAIRIAHRLSLFIDDIDRDGVQRGDTDTRYQVHAIFGEAMAGDDEP